MAMRSLSRFLLILILVAPIIPYSEAVSLSTSGRWIVDEGGRRVKLACVNWAAHLESGAAEGLAKQPLDAISKRVASMGFNCVRLTWPTYMLTNASFSSLTLQRSLNGLGLIESAAALLVNNPHLTNLTLFQAFQAVVSNLGSNDIMVILDNQISKPGWCCSKLDGNGFFGDRYFDPDEWMEGLRLMATTLNTPSSNVVGMSLRNELRGPNQTLTQWYRYMQRGAEVVHSANPNILVILSGLDYDKDLSFLSEKQVELSFIGKLVFELHWYGFSDGGDWDNGNLNEVCASVVTNFTTKAGFLLQQGTGWPLFLSEFGGDVGGFNAADNRFLTCFASVAAELDLDWALWALQGSYYIREGQLGFDETYSVLSWDWCKPRNTEFLRRIAPLQSPFRGPGLSNISPYNVIFHPLTGLCVQKQSVYLPPKLGACTESDAWNYTSTNNIMLKDTEFCLQAEGVGELAKFGISCSESNSKWQPISDSKLQLSAQLHENGSTVCLDVGPNGILETNLCKCQTRNVTCDPESQWFKIITSTRDITSKHSSMDL